MANKNEDDNDQKEQVDRIISDLKLSAALSLVIFTTIIVLSIVLK